MKTTLRSALQNPYPGRGILLGKSEKGEAVLAYFIMGRSPNSRNRVFKKVGETVETQPLDPKKCEDPRLIIYTAFRPVKGALVVANGVQGDSVAAFVNNGGDPDLALEKWEFEPDAPHYTPRISGVIRPTGRDFSLYLSILRRNAAGKCDRDAYTYENVQPGTGYLIHTYAGDGDPLPSFVGAPAEVTVAGDIETLTKALWDSLHADNRISLYVRFTDMQTGAYEERIVNQYE